MATAATLPTLLTTLTSSLTSASSSLPTPAILAPPPDGISLLDTKNELLLSYLHTLLFHILTKLQTHSPNTPSDTQDGPSSDAITKKLVELRLYIEKGVRPLESRLQYQITKLLHSASDAPLTPTTPSASANDPDPDSAPDPSTIPELSYRPNPSAFARPATSTQEPTAIYRPPRITPTALPTTERREKVMRARKSRMLDDFVREEMGDGPVAEASIGAGNGLRGREREREEERRGYEEMRLVRLPGGKKGKGKGRGRRGGDELAGGLDGFGGFDFEGLRGGGKRKREGEGEKDGGGGGGARVGEMWEKRARRGAGRKKR